MPSPMLDQILEGRRSQPHQLIEVLQDVQENYGYIPEEAMEGEIKVRFDIDFSPLDLFVIFTPHHQRRHTN